MGAIRFQDITPTQVEALKAVKVCPEVQKHFDVSQRIPQPFMDSVEVYDPDLDRWSEVTPLCCARMAANAVEFRGQMYVVGGLMMVAGQKRKVCIVPDTMCFNPMDDTWHHKAPLPLPVCNCSLVAHRGRLLAVSGLVRTQAEGSPSQQPMAPIR
ncbi:hypothetical protein MTO96_010026 [Rhipicephalus appendiculatus]